MIRLHMKQIITRLFLLFIVVGYVLISPDASAQRKKNDKANRNYSVGDGDVELVVNGEGVDKTTATHNALRSAIEQAYGVFISTNTTILNDDLIKDEIATVASGNIKAYKELASSTLPNGKTSVSLSAIVTISKLVSYVQSHGGKAELASQTFMTNIKMRELDKNNESKALHHIYMELKEIAPYLFNYSIQLGEPQVGSPIPIIYNQKQDYYSRLTNSDKRYNCEYTLPVSIVISLNDNYRSWLNKLSSVLKSLSVSESERKAWMQNGMETYVFSLFGTNYYLRNPYSKGSCLFECISVINKYLTQWELSINDGSLIYRFLQTSSAHGGNARRWSDLLKRDGDKEEIIITPLEVRVDNPGFELLLNGELPNYYSDRKGKVWPLGFVFEGNRYDEKQRCKISGTIYYPDTKEFIMKWKGRWENPEMVPVRFNDKWFMTMLLPLTYKEMNEFRTIEVKTASEIPVETKGQTKDTPKEISSQSEKSNQITPPKTQFQHSNINDFATWVYSNLRIPDSAKEKKGRAMAQFTVDEEGNVKDVKIVSGIDPALDNEIVRIISASPKWIPFNMDGRSLSRTYTMPFNFQL